jgi:hypothetical protein
VCAQRAEEHAHGNRENTLAELRSPQTDLLTQLVDVFVSAVVADDVQPAT